MDLTKIIETKIKEAIRKGELKNLPGEGKPIELKSPNPLESKDERFFNQVMKSYGLVPIEVLLLKEIESVKQELEDCKIDSEIAQLKKKLKELKLKYDIQMESRRKFIL